MICSLDRLTDRERVRAYLNRDRALTAYALGDLDDAFWPQSAFFGAFAGGELVSGLLLYAGLTPTVLTAFGEREGVRALMAAVDLPDEVYYLWLPEMGDILGAFYDRVHEHFEWRMVLNPAAFTPPGLDDVRLIGPEMANVLDGLYQQAAEPGETVAAFDPWQIAHGVFYGVWQGGELVAAAGTHVYSRAEGVAAIGNVFTRPDCRGRGYASQCTAAVVRAALADGIDTVVLNVREGNDAAIRVYERLGFGRTVQFLEGPALRRGER